MQFTAAYVTHDKDNIRITAQRITFSLIRKQGLGSRLGQCSTQDWLALGTQRANPVEQDLLQDKHAATLRGTYVRSVLLST